MYEEDGARAFVDGVGFDQCPYASGSEAGVDWATGWMMAERGEFRWRHRDIGKMPHRREPVSEAPAEPPTPDLQSQIDTLKAEVERLRTASDVHNFPANLAEPMSGWGAVGENLTTADLTEDVIAGLPRAQRKKFTELLNVELAELQQERSGPREDLKRENEIEALLGLFARVGEM